MTVDNGVQLPAYLQIPSVITFSSRGAVGGGMFGFGACLVMMVVSLMGSDINWSWSWRSSETHGAAICPIVFSFLGEPFELTLLWTVKVATFVRLLPANCDTILSTPFSCIATAIECWHMPFCPSAEREQDTLSSFGIKLCSEAGNHCPPDRYQYWSCHGFPCYVW